MEQFLRVWKILPHPREFDHHFLPQGRELDKKICPGGRDSLAQKIFPGVARGDVPSWKRLRHKVAVFAQQVMQIIVGTSVNLIN